MKTYIQNLRDMSDSNDILESKPHIFTSIFIFILIAIIIIALVWSYLGVMEEYIKAAGVIRPGENISTIRNLVGGRIERVSVEDGESVSMGDTIFRIETESLLVEKDELEHLSGKFERERNNLLKLNQSIRENVNLFDENCNEQAYFYSRFQKFQSDSQAAVEQFENAMIDLQKLKAEAELSKSLAEERLREGEATKRNQITLLESAEKIENLFEPDNIEYYGRFTNYEITLRKLTTTFEQLAGRYERLKRLYEIGGTPRREAEDAKVQKYTANLEIEAFKNEFKTDLRESIRQNTQIVRETSDTLEGLRERLALLNEKRQSAEHTLESIRLGMLVQIEDALNTNRINSDRNQNDLKSLELNIKKANVVSPIEGILHLEAGINEGDFLYSGMKIGTIIPDAGGEFEVQLMVANEDIADIKEGQRIKYRLLAHPFREYGEFEGYVKSIGADAIINPELGGSYFLVKASIEIQDRPQIRVGMVCEARLVTGTRKIILWFLERINLID